MDNEFKKGINDLKNLKPTASERDLMLSRISIGTGINEFEFRKKISTYKEFQWSFLFHGIPLATFLVVFFIFSSGTFLVKSDKSLPGDTLYPVKTGVEEPLMSAISSMSDLSKIEWESDMATRRLNEVEALTEKGSVSTTTLKKAEESIEKNSKNISNIANTKKEGEGTTTQEKKAKVRDDFEKIVEEHNEKLNQLKKNLPADLKSKVENFQMNVLKNLRSKKGDQNKEATSTEVKKAPDNESGEKD
jgi:hypothetical protein